MPWAKLCLPLRNFTQAKVLPVSGSAESNLSILKTRTAYFSSKTEQKLFKRRENYLMYFFNFRGEIVLSRLITRLFSLEEKKFSTKCLCKEYN